MNLIPMKYKNYIWHHNPKELRVSSLKNLKETIIPFNGSIFQNFGREKRVVSGKGEFFGENCIEQFNELFNIFKNKNSGFLSVPNMSPFLAEFKSLEMNIPTKPNIVEYSFEFWEDMSNCLEDIYNSNDTHVVESGETLWDISYHYGVSVEDLLDMNKDIKNPNDLSSGKVVILK